MWPTEKASCFQFCAYQMKTKQAFPLYNFRIVSSIFNKCIYVYEIILNALYIDNLGNFKFIKMCDRLFHHRKYQ